VADLASSRYASIEELATCAKLHPKVVQQALRLAFLSPDLTSAIIEGTQPAGLTLGKIPKLLPLDWSKHPQALG
jgi:site-specific DNA recombinase